MRVSVDVIDSALSLFRSKDKKKAIRLIKKKLREVKKGKKVK